MIACFLQPISLRCVSTMIGLPEGLQSAILSNFCDGKSISSYFVAVSANRLLRGVIYDLIRDAFVDRYLKLSQVHFRTNEEIRDVLDILREEIRMSTATLNPDGTLLCSDSNRELLTDSATQRISDWCAIIEYFDRMRCQTGVKHGLFTLWIGTLQTQAGFGILNHAYLSSTYWSVTAMEYFYDQLELSNHYLMHPASHGAPLAMIDSYFGVLYVENESDRNVLARIEYSLSHDPDSARFMLVPSQMEYEPTVGFARNRHYPELRGLAFLWNGEDDGNFEDALRKLPDNVKRVLVRMKMMLS